MLGFTGIGREGRGLRVIDYEYEQTQPKSIPQSITSLGANYGLRNAGSTGEALEVIQPCRLREKHHRHSETALEDVEFEDAIRSVHCRERPVNTRSVIASYPTSYHDPGVIWGES